MSGRRRRRRKRAATASTGYSMSSSVLFRTEGQTLLDDRFDKIEEMYNEDSDEEDEAPPKVLPEVRQDFNSIMDEFLGSYNVTGKKKKTQRVRKGKFQTGMDQLEEIRRELGGLKMT